MTQKPDFQVHFVHAVDVQLTAGLMANLWRRSHDRIRQRVTRVATAVGLLAKGRLAPEGRRQAIHDARKLAGGLYTFGRQQASEQAQEIKVALESRGRLRPGDARRLNSLASQLRSAVLIRSRISRSSTCPRSRAAP